MKNTFFSVFCVAILVLIPFTAFAYLDPASGSMIIQIIIGAIAASFITIKLFWHKIKGFFGFKKHKNNDEKTPEQNKNLS